MQCPKCRKHQLIGPDLNMAFNKDHRIPAWSTSRKQDLTVMVGHRTSDRSHEPDLGEYDLDPMVRGHTVMFYCLGFEAWVHKSELVGIMGGSARADGTLIYRYWYHGLTFWTPFFCKHSHTLSWICMKSLNFLSINGEYDSHRQGPISNLIMR